MCHIQGSWDIPGDERGPKSLSSWSLLSSGSCPGAYFLVGHDRQ